MATNNTFATIGTSSTTVSAERNERVSAVYANDSTQIMYLAVGASAVIGSGIRLAPGEKFVVQPGDRLNGSISGICASGSANLSFYENYN